MKIARMPEENQSLVAGKSFKRLKSLYIRSDVKEESISKPKQYLQKVVEGKVVTITMALITVYALIGDDLRLWTMDKWVDPFHYSILML